MAGLTILRRAIPKGARISKWRAPDGWALRRFDWVVPKKRARGAILFQGGRGDVFEKYLEIFGHWHERGWSVTSFDWRGQGGSGRLSADTHVGHAADFAPYVADLAAVWREWSGKQPGPHVLMGHSMGGHLVLRALLERVVDPQAAVLVAPMLGLRGPIGATLGETVAWIMRAKGNPARPAWKPAKGRPGAKADRQNTLTNDRERYADEQWWYEQMPDIKLGPPSWAWLTEAFASTRAQRADPRLETMTTPTLMLVPEADSLVDPKASLTLAARLPNSELVRFGRESAHEILRETDPIRDRAIAAIDAFLDVRAPAR